MKIVVIGGTGLIGTKVVNNLRQLGHEVTAGSPSTGINTLTGEGLAEALANTDAVIDLANSPSFEDKAVLDFFQTSGRNLLAAEINSGVKHHVALSIVGVDIMQESGYMRAKIAQEELIKKSGVPYTIIRSTQFLEFMGSIAGAATEGTDVHLSTVDFQPIAATDVANFVTEFTLATPNNNIEQIAGPGKYPMNEIVAKYLSDTKDARTVVPNGEAKYFGAAIGKSDLVPQGKTNIGATSYEKWLADQPVKA